MSITLPELPYKKDALAPVISEKVIDFHYGKHHNTYVANLVKLIEGTPLENETLETIIQESAGDAQKVGIFNNAAQVWNHNFYWLSMKPHGGGEPSGKIAEMINNDFGSFGAFAKAFKDAGLNQFGSGWAWLALKDNQLQVTKTSNADTPLVHGLKPILTVDVWEHAYYLDYQNRRGDYLDAFIKNLINWDFANTMV